MILLDRSGGGGGGGGHIHCYIVKVSRCKSVSFIFSKVCCLHIYTVNSLTAMSEQVVQTKREAVLLGFIFLAKKS